MTIAIVDIIIGAIMLIFIIIGLSKGLIKGILGLVGTIVSLVAAVYLAQPFITFIDGLFDGNVISYSNGLVEGWIGAIGNAFTVELTSESDIQALLLDALTGLGLPANIATTLAAPIAAAIAGAVGDSYAGHSIATLLAPVLANIGLMIISTMVLFILIRMAVFIVEKILDNTILKVGALRALDRLLGMVFGALQGAIIVVLLFTGVALFASNPDYVVKQAIDESIVGSAIYENNPLPEWITDNVDIAGIINGIFNPADAPEDEAPVE